ncbi:hypothetical protein K1T71_012950 [Dendrolimus kikuchii]|uniref:Uncharacterized protein n=1 Tax=Dendrolimus kikuchii TaxID=765133 RepID=A0ACC1CIN3_9NEOP|nr:hypothetical protein K1T71_012950 [Dendrolimus kikuchii]
MECERKKILLVEQKIASNNDQPEKRDDYHFFMSLQPQMKQFSELLKLRIRNKITQVIIDEAERMQFSCHQRRVTGWSTTARCPTNDFIPCK